MEKSVRFFIFRQRIEVHPAGKSLSSRAKKKSNKCGTFLPLDHHIHHKGSSIASK
jgi:hypothetical protein